eukprot:9766977-Heterocapsa_arctica.AAC.1
MRHWQVQLGPLPNPGQTTWQRKVDDERLREQRRAEHVDGDGEFVVAGRLVPPIDLLQLVDGTLLAGCRGFLLAVAHDVAKLDEASQHPRVDIVLVGRDNPESEEGSAIRLAAFGWPPKRLRNAQHVGWLEPKWLRMFVNGYGCLYVCMHA